MRSVKSALHLVSAVCPITLLVVAGCRSDASTSGDASSAYDAGSITVDASLRDGSLADARADAPMIALDAEPMPADMGTVVTDAIVADPDARVADADAFDADELSLDSSVADAAWPDATLIFVDASDIDAALDPDDASSSSSDAAMAVDAGPPPLPSGYFLPSAASDALFMHAWAAHDSNAAIEARGELYFGGDPGLDVTVDSAWPGTWVVLKHACEHGGTLLLDTSFSEDVYGISFAPDESAMPGSMQSIFVRVSTEASAASVGARGFLCCDSETEACETSPDAIWTRVGPIHRGAFDSTPNVDAPALAPLAYQVDGMLGEHRISLDSDATALAGHVVPSTMGEPQLSVLGTDTPGVAVRATYPGALASPFVAAFDLSVSAFDSESEGEGISFFWGHLSTPPPTTFGDGWAFDGGVEGEPDADVPPAPHPWLGELPLVEGRVASSGFSVHFAPGQRQSVTLFGPMGDALGTAFLDAAAFDTTLEVVVRVLPDQVRVWIGDDLVIDANVDASAVPGTDWGFSSHALSGATGYTLSRVRARTGTVDASSAVEDERADPSVATWASWIPGVFYDGNQANTAEMMASYPSLLAQGQVCAKRARNVSEYVGLNSLRYASFVTPVRGEGLLALPISDLAAMWAAERDNQAALSALNEQIVAGVCENIWTAPMPDDRYAPRESPSVGKTFGPDVSVPIGQRNWMNDTVDEILVTHGAMLDALTDAIAFGDFDGSMMTSMQIQAYLLPNNPAIFTESTPDDNLRRLRLALVIQLLSIELAELDTLDPQSARATRNVALLRQIRNLVEPLTIRLREGETTAPIGADASVDFGRVFDAYLLLQALSTST